ncbi:hypothetical protein HMPREF9442_02172 [Paraprevotella xylaniphila YIT 11841]|uniref:Uncharacterized protein n=1 Tax=Paraprevotella xylaniphila YIT 11841 TaxID=762982 RepID=F3QVE6_9BACT|nr:hypothetical protein HMPREF9442_02172 [Paraprevotella xylaniphila YIT 11841]
MEVLKVCGTRRCNRWQRLSYFDWVRIETVGFQSGLFICPIRILLFKGRKEYGMIYDGKRVGKCILVRFILSLVILCLIPMWGKNIILYPEKGIETSWLA